MSPDFVEPGNPPVQPYTRPIDAEGQAGLTPPIEAFVTRARSLSDDERRVIAEARSAVDEPFHAAALAAAAEALVGRGDDYARARILLARAHVPEQLDSASADDGALWQTIARLAQLAIDDALLALSTSDVIHPKHVRELFRSFHALPS